MSGPNCLSVTLNTVSPETMLDSSQPNSKKDSRAGDGGVGGVGGGVREQGSLRAGDQTGFHLNLIHIFSYRDDHSIP